MSFQLRDARPEDADAIRILVTCVLDEYHLSADPADTDADLSDIEASYTKRGGVFRVLTDEAGKGHGRRLLDTLLSEAKARGYRRVVLETASQLKEAIALYRSAGFKPYQREHLACRCDQAFALELTE